MKFQMKIKRNLMVNVLGVLLIALSYIITSTASFGYIGEPDVPENLLD
ncbi:cyclic lactone autoinducer peptide [Clostridium sp. MB40-C1]|nr:cyclic lactone autoinducer peptide [Clostridium sp. MB40-C1]WMJ79420.1 cyclic lactone autoinducer peptide [Clostridium sp. MB40-C1]